MTESVKKTNKRKRSAVWEHFQIVNSTGILSAMRYMQLFIDFLCCFKQDSRTGLYLKCNYCVWSNVYHKSWGTASAHNHMNCSDCIGFACVKYGHVPIDREVKSPNYPASSKQTLLLQDAHGHLMLEQQRMLYAKANNKSAESCFDWKSTIYHK